MTVIMFSEAESINKTGCSGADSRQNGYACSHKRAGGLTATRTGGGGGKKTEKSGVMKYETLKGCQQAHKFTFKKLKRFTYSIF